MNVYGRGVAVVAVVVVVIMVVTKNICGNPSVA